MSPEEHVHTSSLLRLLAALRALCKGFGIFPFLPGETGAVGGGAGGCPGLAPTAREEAVAQLSCCAT